MSDGIKHDQGKLRYDLIPPEALEEVVKVLTFGANKYDDDNWKNFGDKIPATYIPAGMRHFEKYRAGEKLDPESGLQHLAHDICCKLFLLWYELQKNEKSD